MSQRSVASIVVLPLSSSEGASRSFQLVGVSATRSLR